MQNLIDNLRRELTKLESQASAIRNAISALNGSSTAGSDSVLPSGKRGKHYVSASSRAKMAASQKARWAKIRAGKKGA